MNRTLHRVWKRASDARGPVRGQPRGYLFGGIGIPLTALVLAVALIPNVLETVNGPLVPASKGDQPVTAPQTGRAVAPAGAVERDVARADSEATPAIEVAWQLSPADPTATPLTEVVATLPTPGAEATPVTKVESDPPLIEYLADPAKIEGGLWVEVSLTKQTMVVFKGQVPILRSVVSTGKPGFETPTGIFYVERMLAHDDMQGQFIGDEYYYPDVPNVMYFTNRGHALHGVYWHDDFGTPLSHGCVGMPLEAAEFLFGMAHVGMGMEIFY